MKLIFERSVQGRCTALLPDAEKVDFGELSRTQRLRLPEVSENDISRHYTELSKQVHGVNDGIYPLGSCTMKYNPKLGEDAAALAGFTDIHPLQQKESVSGAAELLAALEEQLCDITGMDAMTLQPAAGAQGEFAGLLTIKAYHKSRGDDKRKKIIIPDSAHGTNPASASMAGFEVVNICSDAEGCVDLSALEAVLSDEIAGLMLTNPNTVGIFDKNILRITELVHSCGGLNYYDGANLNAIMGIVRPGDMGFDVIHCNLHKTFGTPHGGGGPGSGPVGCKAFLKDFMPRNMKLFYGNFLVNVKAFAYITMLGRDGIREAAQQAVLNANYLRCLLRDTFNMPYDTTCMHEFVVSLEKEKEELGITAMDVAKALMDYGIHAPTMYFPLIVHEALMFEPTETESKENLEHLAQVLAEIMARAKSDTEYIKSAPHTTKIGRPDETAAARMPRTRYSFD